MRQELFSLAKIASIKQQIQTIIFKRKNQITAKSPTLKSSPADKSPKKQLLSPSSVNSKNSINKKSHNTIGQGKIKQVKLNLNIQKIQSERINKIKQKQIIKIQPVLDKKQQQENNYNFYSFVKLRKVDLGIKNDIKNKTNELISQKSTIIPNYLKKDLQIQKNKETNNSQKKGNFNQSVNSIYKSIFDKNSPMIKGATTSRKNSIQKTKVKSQIKIPYSKRKKQYDLLDKRLQSLKQGSQLLKPIQNQEKYQTIKIYKNKSPLNKLYKIMDKIKKTKQQMQAQHKSQFIYSSTY